MKTFLFIVRHTVESADGLTDYLEKIELINIDAESEIQAQCYLEFMRNWNPCVDIKATCLNGLPAYDIASLMLEYTNFHSEVRLKDIKIILDENGKVAA
ncbi:MAG TPA: hypothetical protein DCL80_15310 [Balneola sp.]|nr:hypothetical protein [Balneola sp.]MAO78894.1 hypothetical protein [Balneola sp.]MBF63553.1 hypothetical protein [Balneola sp.]HAH52541.1 hypothetical protein [Balneola sp.]HAW81409.1 hypothetical protein [Balneola sp.]|tara:strand:- start:2946 stop:3242 length:297 start_codon:yes stop_codon:yes gene_type:complete